MPLNRTQIKICGITNMDDALTAVEAGADYLGFIFYPPSKRSISVKEAQCITSHLRTLENPPLLVGVFVDETADDMAGILDLCELDLAQLSGSEPPGMTGDPASPIFGRSYKALKPITLAEAEAEVEWYLPAEPQEDRPSLLIDTYHPQLPGGTGLTADWTIAAALGETTQSLMLAGGLNPDNVAEAIRAVRPMAVDVASGVEAEPGRKDPEKVRAFVEAVRSVGPARRPSRSEENTAT